jgi:hypothetical protein
VQKINRWKPVSKRHIGRPKTRRKDDVLEDVKSMDVRNWKNVAQNRDSLRRLLVEPEPHLGCSTLEEAAAEVTFGTCLDRTWSFSSLLSSWKVRLQCNIMIVIATLHSRVYDSSCVASGHTGRVIIRLRPQNRHYLNNV